MFAPVPDEPVFTVERRIVNADVPRFLELWRLLSDLFSTFSAVLVGGGGGAGGGGGGGIFGDDIHIVNLWLRWFRFGVYFVQLEIGLQSVVRNKKQARFEGRCNQNRPL